jgi:HPt (histidine-containing phosphotransfer) domain-containing protein
MEDNSKKLYDLINLEEIGGGSDEFVVEMIKLFIIQAKNTIKGFNSAYDKKDLEEIRSLAHQIKPSIDNIKITLIMPVIREIENLAEDNGPAEKMVPCIMEVNTVLENVIVQLESELSERSH